MMTMVNFEVWIEGTSPMLQHRFSEDAEVALSKPTRRVSESRGTPRGQAEKVAYRLKNGNLWFPAAGISRLLREAGANHKQKGSRRAVKYLVPASTLVLAEAMPLFDKPKGAPLTDFEVDSRPVVIPATKGRVMRHRARLEKWAGMFRIRINDDLIPPQLVHQLLVEGGQQIGLGDFRPEKGGPFGTFNVVEWLQI